MSAPPRPEQPERSPGALQPEVVEDRVDAAPGRAGGSPAYGSPARESTGSTPSARSASWCWSDGGPDHPQTARPGELHEHGADAAARAVHDDGAVVRDAGRVDEHLPGGDAVHDDRLGGVRLDAVGHGHEVVDADDRAGRPRPGLGRRREASAEQRLRAAGPDRHDAADEVVARHEGERRAGPGSGRGACPARRRRSRPPRPRRRTSPGPASALRRARPAGRSARRARAARCG